MSKTLNTTSVLPQDYLTMDKDALNELIRMAREIKKQKFASAPNPRDRYIVSVGKAVANCLQAIAKLNSVEGVSDETWASVEAAIAPLQIANYRASAAGVTVKVRKGGGGRKKKVAPELVETAA
jgi:hypothetical protein